MASFKSPPLSSETRFLDFERKDGYVSPKLGIAASDAFSTDFAFVNYIEHKSKQILGFYGKKQHKGKC